MDKGTVTTSLIALLSLVVSLFVLWRQHQVEGRAHFTAEWEASDSLVYLNHGPGPAKDVQVNLDAGGGLVEQRIAYMGAYQTMRIEAMRRLGEAPPRRLNMSWIDNRRKRQSIAIPLPDSPQAYRYSPASRDSLEKAVREIASDEANRKIEMYERSKRTRRFI